MLDLNYVRDNMDKVSEALEKRHASEDMFAQLKNFADADKDRRSAIGESDRFNAERNKLSKEVGGLMKQGATDDAAKLRSQVNELKSLMSDADAARERSEERMREILSTLPNIPHESVPVGKEESDSVE